MITERFASGNGLAPMPDYGDDEVEEFESDPIPFTGRRPCEPFPVDSLPATIGRMVRALAEATQTDPAMAGTSALSVMAAASGGRAEVEARSGWREPLCLFTATIAHPGERKSAVQAAMRAPLHVAEQTLAEAGASARCEAETTRQVAEKAAEQARTIAGRANADDNKHGLLAQAISAARSVEAIRVPPIPRIVADDITPEAAATLLAEQGGRLAIISAEGGIFDIMAGRYSNGVPNIDVFVKGHAGDPITIDRRGRAPEYVPRPALTVGVMIQPSVLTTIGQHATFRGRGLLARFLYAHPVSKVGRRKAGASPVPQDIEAAYHQSITTIVKELAGWGSDLAILNLDEHCADAVIGLETDIEPQLAEDGELGALADWGSKYVGAVLRIAALLHLADLGPVAAVRVPIPEGTLRRAATIGGYYKEQAVAAFGEMQTDEATADAVYLLGRLAKHSEPTVSLREMQRLAKRFKTSTELEAPVARLVDHGWLTPVKVDREGHTGRPSGPQFTIHSKVRE